MPGNRLALLAARAVGRCALAEPYAALGSLYTRQRLHIEAFKTLDRALALDPNDVTANFWHATALCETGYMSRCSEGLDRVLALDPMMPNALAWRGREYVRSGELDKAARLLQRAADAGLAHAGMAQSVLDEAQGWPDDADT